MIRLLDNRIGFRAGQLKCHGIGTVASDRGGANAFGAMLRSDPLTENDTVPLADTCKLLDVAAIVEFCDAAAWYVVDSNVPDLLIVELNGDVPLAVLVWTIPSPCVSMLRDESTSTTPAITGLASAPITNNTAAIATALLTRRIDPPRKNSLGKA